MRLILILSLLIVIISIIDGRWDNIRQQLDIDYDYRSQSDGRIPFPKCISTERSSRLLSSSSIQNLFVKELEKQDVKVKYERVRDNNRDTNDFRDFDSIRIRSETRDQSVLAATATKVSDQIISNLSCETKASITPKINSFLRKFKIPSDLCKIKKDENCGGRTQYRLINGVCNNIDRPFDGSSETAYERLLTAQYDDSISEPRRKSVRGGLLPSCRSVSLALGSKPIFDRNYNNLFVTFGQFMAHDISLATPVGDSHSSPISTCTCDSDYDWNKCTVIDVEPDDPYLHGQKCMAFPATAQAFRNRTCTLGVKEQMNKNTAALDASSVYGSNLRTAQALRSDKGLLKTTRRQWAKDFPLPPAQRDGKTCVDATPKRKCFAGGDSRLMINLALTGIQTITIRGHNNLATALAVLNPTWPSDKLYEETRRIIIAIFQRIAYTYWFPILFGKTAYTQYFGQPDVSVYDNTMAPVVYNEVASAAFRLHSLVRDLFSRCTYDGKRIDELWLVDIMDRAKYAYDIENNGIDSILCGLLYDYGFAYDSNFANQIHHRLFETTNKYGKTWRNDLIAINICRSREHGIRSYNAYLKFCGYKEADEFNQFIDTINYEGIQTLKKIYKSTDDVELFVGLSFEDPIPGGLIGRVGACLIAKQFQVLRDGDRLFYSHPDVFTPAQFAAITSYQPYCYFCDTVDIKQVPLNPFQPPNDNDNQLQDCSLCQELNLSPWINV